ncbi:MAG TPA: aldo/keto reductase [Puia sp.]|nr:aldo/keto reductase [Puia sp.]
MQYHRLGHSSLLVSSIGFGCMSLGDREPDNEKLLHSALDLGINFFDTADLYAKGLNEEAVGKILKDKREKVVLATKVGNQLHSDGSGWEWNAHPDYIIRSVEGSLTRLKTDRIDLYQLHGGTMEDPIDETIGAFELLQQQGKIRYYGISSIRPEVIREYVRRSRITSVMMQYSLLDRRPEESCLDLLGKSGIGVLARGGLAKGLLVGKSPAAYLDHPVQQVARAASVVRSLSGSRRSPSQTAIGYISAHPSITCAVTGFRTTEQLEAIMLPKDPPALTDAEIKILRGAIPVYPYTQYR